VFTLTTSDSSLLLHIKDTTKIEIIEGQKSGESGPPCASWKDRHAQVEFTSTPDSVANGEIRVLTLE
jgi:hypothetical protein